MSVSKMNSRDSFHTFFGLRPFRWDKSAVFLLLCSALLFQSCIGQQEGSSAGRTSASSSTSNDSEQGDNDSSPDFSQNLNFLQNGENQSSTSLEIRLDFTDSIYLRGPGIDEFIRTRGDNQLVQCLVSYHPSSEDNKILVTALSPKDFYNFSNSQKEHYYLIDMGSASKNKNFCQKPGLLSTLSNLHPGDTIGWNLATFCDSSNCDETIYSGNSLQAFTPSGNAIDDFDVSNLSFRLRNQSGSSFPSGSSCDSNSECTAQGYDCCANGQCVNDGEVKDGAKSQYPSDYQQSLEDISGDSNAIFNYPHIYHICSSDPNTNPTPEPDDTNENEEADERFTEKKELYQCTTPVEAEAAYCTLTFENASVADGNDDGELNDTFQTKGDDRNFTDTYSGDAGLPEHPIQGGPDAPTSLKKVVYAGEVLFEEQDSGNIIKDSSLTISGANDTLSDSLEVEIQNKTLPSSSSNDTLKLTYKVDGTCERVTSNLARCTKYYVQGQGDSGDVGKIDDHHPASDSFQLPPFADTSRTIKVTVDDRVVMQGTEWELDLSAPPSVEFQGSGLQVFDTQEVAITYFVNTEQHDVLQAKMEAKEKIGELCGCKNNDCSLKPKRNDDGDVVDYICDYPDPPTPEPPLQQTVMLSAKATPHRYFDQTGLAHDEVSSEIPPQEGQQFKYVDGSRYKPNNMQEFDEDDDAYVGFNEIYGSYSSEPQSALPAKQIDVKKGTTYDIFIDSGSYSSCFYCGHDYYSNLVKLFPKNFTTPGGGYIPEGNQTSKLNPEEFRADDLIFGRACFVPATMIPWTHSESSDTQLQRLKRLQAQHFLYANGYQRDWFGFDYGSVIGSFDGVKWFSVGSQRRIKAETDKLFLAINAPFGDLTSETAYSATISESSINPNLNDPVTNDFESDGAQCQQYHVCNTDADCAKKLGWEYSCENISNTSTKWPVFNDNAREIPNASSIERLITLTKSFGGGSKRCVYRGRGTPCETNYAIAANNPENTYNKTEELGQLTCSANNYCEEIINGVPQEEFNNRISRFARSIRQQNASDTISQDTLNEFGLGARLIGRPLKYSGDEAVASSAAQGLSQNNVQSLCIPGRNPANSGTSYNDAKEMSPGNDHQGDKVNAMGVTPASNQAADHYMNACSVFDDNDGDYLYKAETALTKNLASSRIHAGRQAVPTNSLRIFEDVSLAGKDLLKDFENEFIEDINYQENRCLRAPGSACHTDMDCAPNELIKEKIGALNYNFDEHGNIINEYEFKYWQEELICSQPASPDEEEFDLSKNRCCRATGKDISIGTLINQEGFSSLDQDFEEFPDFDNESVPGTEIDLDDSKRYTRLSTVEDLLENQGSTHPPLESARNDRCDTSEGCYELKTNQWRTLSKMAERTSCSGHWVRNFSQANGGGHEWTAEKFQTIDKRVFRCKNWEKCDPDRNECPGYIEFGEEFTCSHVDNPQDPKCRIRNITSFEGDKVFSFMERLELTGIPQIPVQNRGYGGARCTVHPQDQEISIKSSNLSDNSILQVPGGDPLLVQSSNSGGEVEIGSDKYFAAHEEDNFNSNVKEVFSSDSFSSCIPAGAQVDQTTEESMCCTGFINEQTSRCALPDYADVSLFFNRFVSSAAKDLNEGLIDEETGYITSTSTVEQLACIEKVCASGFLARGVALSDLKVPGHSGEDESYKVRRFIDSNNEATNFNGLSDLYDAGLKWNNHVYCVPQDLAGQDSNGLEITDCSGF